MAIPTDQGAPLTDTQTRFLDHYAKNGVVQHALDHVHLHRSVLKDWRRNPQFVEALNEAREASVELAEGELRRRAVGYEENLIFQGSVVYQRDPATGDLLLDDNFEPIPFKVKKHSDRLLEVFMKANDPKYNDKTRVEHTGEDGGPIKGELTVKYVMPEGKTKEDYED